MFIRQDFNHRYKMFVCYEQGVFLSVIEILSLNIKTMVTSYLPHPVHVAEHATGISYFERLQNLRK